LGNGTVGAWNGVGTVVNQGLLEGDGGALSVGAAAARNSGTIQAVHGGTVAINTNLDNSGGLIAADASTLYIDRSASGVAVTGGTFQLTNSSTLSNGYYSGGNSYPGTISGSTLSFTGGSTLTGNYGTLTNITIAPDTALNLSSTSGQTFSGTLT